ncbi:MAG: carboxypeptidase regulatory-like domain-containing protein [Planctomycetes bacterium]|nr:carboxypeptidase regulatory-like domain-containing protein [Planctomycetota bacterium]
MKKIPLVLGLVGAAIVLALAWVLLSDDAATDDVVLEAPPASTAAAAPKTTLAPLAAAGERTVLEVSSPVVPPVAAAVDEVPASYLRALGALVGRVVEPSGEPVPDIEVAIVGGGPSTFLVPSDGLLSPDLHVPDLLLGKARTDAEGRFRIAGLETRVLGAVLVDPGGPRAFFTVLEQVPESGVDRDLGDIVLPASVTFAGTVVDERDEPIPGVRVRAIELPSIALESGVADFHAGCTFLVEDDNLAAPFVFVPPSEVERYEKLLPIPTTRTDADGRFELTGVRPGLPSLVLDDGVHEARVNGPIPSGPAGRVKDLGRVPMGDGETVVVRVVDEQQEPVPGASVMVGNRMSVGPVAILKGPYTTGDDGRVSVGGLRASLASGVARTEAGIAWTASAAPVSAGGGQELSIVLGGERSVTVEVVDPSGARIDDVRLLGRAMPDDDAEDVPDFLLRPAPLDDRVTKDDQGRPVVSPLAPGLWEIVAVADGWSIGRDFVDLTWHDDVLRLELQPVRGQPIRVVRASDASPVEHALVTVYDSERFGRQVTTARTKADGGAQLQGLADGDYSIEVMYPGLAVTQRDIKVPSDEPIVVELTVGGTISGIVIDRGAPPAEPLLVMLEARGGGMRAGGPRGGGMPRMTVCDLDGEFSFADVDPGNVEISARERFDLSGSLTSWWEPFAMTALAETEVEVVSAQESEAILQVGSTLEGIETGRVRGRLLVNGRPAEGWKIRTWGRIRRSATTAADGSFDMGSLEAGDVSLMIGSGNESFPGASVEVHEFELQPNADEFLELSLRTGTVGGRVVDALTNQPIEGARVTVRSTESKGRWWGGRSSFDVTGPDGRFEMEPVGEGSYLAEIEMDGFARQTSEAFDVPAQGTARVPDVRLTRGLKVSGKLTLVDAAEAPDWIWLNATTSTGSRATARPDKNDMTYTFDDMAPGTWEVSIYTSNGVEYEPISIVVTGSTEQQALTFRPAPPPDPQVTEQLEALGYLGDTTDEAVQSSDG